MKNEYKKLLNEMIPNAERFGSRMGLARHQAARMKRVIDAHNANVDFKAFKNQGVAEVSPWDEKELTSRAERIKTLAQAHGAHLGFMGDPSTRQSAYAKTQPSEVKLAQLDYQGKPEQKVDFSRLSDAQREEGQKKADEIRKTGIADRRVKAKREAESRERDRISRAFTFESIVKKYTDMIRETYRITPKRRELLNRMQGQAQQNVENQMSGAVPFSNMDVMSNTSKMARIDAIKQMAVPQDKRTGHGLGLSDKQLKTVMGNTRATQKAIEGIKAIAAKHKK